MAHSWELASTPHDGQMVSGVPDGLTVSTCPSRMCLHCNWMCLDAKFCSVVGSTLAHLRPEAFLDVKINWIEKPILTTGAGFKLLASAVTPHL